jgi:hypothetical protein
MVKVTYDAAHNAVIMEFSGKVDVPQMEKLCRDLQKVVPENCGGFKLLTDLSGIDSVDLAVREPVKKLMDFLNLKGVKEIIRVIPDPSHDIGLNIMSHFHYSKDVQFVTVESREEAQARL